MRAEACSQRGIFRIQNRARACRDVDCSSGYSDLQLGINLSDLIDLQPERPNRRSVKTRRGYRNGVISKIQKLDIINTARIADSFGRHAGVYVGGSDLGASYYRATRIGYRPAHRSGDGLRHSYRPAQEQNDKTKPRHCPFPAHKNSS